MDLTDWEDIQNHIRHIAISASAGDSEIVSAVSGRRIVVVSLALFSAQEDTSIQFDNGINGTSLTGTMPLYNVTGTLITSESKAGAVLLPFSPAGWFKTSLNTSLSLEVTGGDVNGVLGYLLS